MSKNLIYTTAINHDSSTFENSDYSQYCLNSWKAWCDKNNIDFFVIDKHDSRYEYPVWNKDLKQFVDKNGVAPEAQPIEDEITLGVEDVKTNILAAAGEITENDLDGEEATDDLPF